MHGIIYLKIKYSLFLNEKNRTNSITNKNKGVDMTAGSFHIPFKTKVAAEATAPTEE